MKLIQINFIILFMFFNILFLSASEYNFGIIKGENVNIRVKPYLKSGILRKNFKDELVLYLDKTAKKNRIKAGFDYWYKIKTFDKKTGWVFGKYFYNIDKSDNERNKYNFIIVDHLINTTHHINPDVFGKVIIYRVNFDKIRDNIIFRFKILEKRVPSFPETISWTLFYKENKDKLSFVLQETGIEMKIYFIEEYILLLNKSQILCYDTKKFVKGPYAFRNDRFYKLIAVLHLKKIIGFPYYKSNIEFDEKSRVAKVNIQKKKDEPFKTELYLFDDGKFIMMNK